LRSLLSFTADFRENDVFGKEEVGSRFDYR
jgi:hypothetical protein